MFLYTLYGSPQCPSPTALITFSYTLHTYGEYYIMIETFTRPSTKPTSAVLGVATTWLKAGLEIRVGCASRLGWLSQSWQRAGSCGRDLIPVATSGSVLAVFFFFFFFFSFSKSINALVRACCPCQTAQNNNCTYITGKLCLLSLT